MTEYRAKKAYQNQEAAETYDSVRFTSFSGKLVDKLEKTAFKKGLAGIPQSSRILDLPCGTGRFTELLLDMGYKATGADISEEMIAVATRKLEGFKNLEGIFKADAESLFFKHKDFDCVTAVRLFGHIPPGVRIKILREMKRVSKKKIIVFYYLTDPITAFRKKIKELIVGKNKAPWFVATKNNLREEANKAGLKIEKMIPMARFMSEAWVIVLTP